MSRPRHELLASVLSLACASSIASCQARVDTTTIVPLVEGGARANADAAVAIRIPGDPDEMTPVGDANTLLTWFRARSTVIAAPAPQPTMAVEPPAPTPTPAPTIHAAAAAVHAPPATNASPMASAAAGAPVIEDPGGSAAAGAPTAFAAAAVAPPAPAPSPTQAAAAPPTWGGGGAAEGTVGLGNVPTAQTAPRHARASAGASGASRSLFGRDWGSDDGFVDAAPHPAGRATRSEPAANAATPPSSAHRVVRIASPTTREPRAPRVHRSVTNNQVEGVDEGDIVKVWGDYLVVLRRGRLFTIHVGNGRPTASGHVDAFPPGAMPASWYDEILVHGSTILVIGFGGGAGGTQINRFDIDDNGALTYRDTLAVRSNDYFARQNYASRVVGNRLVLYTPVPVTVTDTNAITNAIPAVRTQRYGTWNTALDYSQLFLPVQDTASAATIHSVLVCDLAQTNLPCRATGIVGPSSRQFFVSNTAVYVWVPGAPWQRVRGAPERPGAERAVVYRFPLDGDPPSAIRVTGRPENQLSFEERDGELRVLVRDFAHADGTHDPAELGLLRIATARFRRHLEYPGADALTVLPANHDTSARLVNRFVANHLLWSDIDRTPTGAVNVIVRVHDLATRITNIVPVTHGVERLEAIGSDAVVIGNGEGSLRFTAIDLAPTPTAGGTFTLDDARQGESRSHGFFFSPRAEGHGTIGLPYVDANFVRTRDTMNTGSAGIVFLAVDDLQFSELGRLDARPSTRSWVDRCQASCTDWYGNARPLFVDGRTFALLGYELVEGRIVGNHLREASRLEFLGDIAAPAPDRLLE